MGCFLLAYVKFWLNIAFIQVGASVYSLENYNICLYFSDHVIASSHSTYFRNMLLGQNPKDKMPTS